MWRIYLPLMLGWLALLPPFFTNGVCQREFESAATLTQSNLEKLGSSARALQRWASLGVPAAIPSQSECRSSSNRLSLPCGTGTLVVAHVPIQNTVCRIYRDDEVRVQLQFDEHDSLVRLATDMNPYRSLPVPFSSVVVHWGR
jgi:hypothetical protein